jgi:hypothetical protein
VRRRSPAVLLLLLAATSGCTADPETAGPAPATSSFPSSAPSAPEPPVPTLAGSEEAQIVAGLPSGPASGTAVLAYSGVGEVREPFRGECSHDGDTTRIQGSADTARILVEIATDGASLTLDDDGFAATSSLTTGRYLVAGGRLSLAAGLAQDSQAVGTVELVIECGG